MFISLQANQCILILRCVLFAGPYLIVITRREKVGEVDQKTIWKVTGTEVISYQRTLLHLNEQQVYELAD